MKLNNYELKDINGGGFWTTTTVIIVSLAAAFLFGVLDGIVNPQECN